MCYFALNSTIILSSSLSYDARSNGAVLAVVLDESVETIQNSFVGR
jgi:hypothetical protein